MIKDFNLAGKYVKSSVLVFKIKAISLEKFNKIKDLTIFLSTKKNSNLLVSKILKDFDLPKSLIKAVELAISHKRSYLTKEIFKYWLLYYQKNVQYVMNIKSACDISEDEIKICTKFMQKKVKNIKPQLIIDKSLISGIRLETPYYLWDNTIKQKINTAVKFLNNLAGDI